MSTEDVNFPERNPNEFNIFRTHLVSSIQVVQNISRGLTVLQDRNGHPITTTTREGVSTEAVANIIPQGAQLVQAQCGLIPLEPGKQISIGLGDPDHPAVVIKTPVDVTQPITIDSFVYDNYGNPNPQSTPLDWQQLVMVGREGTNPSLIIADNPSHIVHVKANELQNARGAPVSSRVQMLGVIVSVPRLNGRQLARDAVGNIQYIRCLLVQNIGVNPLYF